MQTYELHPIAARLRQIGSNAPVATAKSLLKEAGKPQRLARDVVDLADTFRKTARRRLRDIGRRGQYGRGLPIEAPLSRRLELRVADLAWASFHRYVRYGAAGGSTQRIILTDDPRKVGYTVIVGSTFGVYKGSFKNYSAATDDHRITLPHNWLTRVAKRGLAVIDGLPTLDLSPLDAPKGVELFAAKWAEQGRGYSVTTRTGYIAMQSAGSGRPIAFHGATQRAALAGLSKKLNAALPPLDRPAVKAMARRVAAHADALATWADAAAVGACDYGVRAWCYRVGIDPSRDSLPLADVWAGYLVDAAPEARAVVMTVLRRCGG